MVSDFFSTAPLVAWSLVSVVLAMVVIALNWPKVRWWWHNTLYSTPLVGGIARLSKDPNRDSSDPLWFKAEKTLCRDYKQFIRVRDENDFDEKVAYLTKAGDLGRKNTPPLIWVLTIVLVFVEAMGFSYVLAGYTVPGASENMQQTADYGIAFMLSVILVAFTHFAGHEWYKSGKVRQARQEWVEGGRKGKTHTGQIALAKPQFVDDDQPGYVQLMNRVGTSSSFSLTIITAVLVLIVAIGATYVRGQVLEKQLHQQTTGQAGGASKDGGVEVASIQTQTGGVKIVLPADDAAANRSVDEKAQAEENSIDRHGGWGTFIVLAFIFLFLQLLGVVFGKTWGFAGKESAAAFAAIGAGRYSSYADVREHYREIADVAQSKLEQLQQKLMERNSATGHDGQHTTQTFYGFMDVERDREDAEVRRDFERKASRLVADPPPLTQAAPQAPQAPQAVAPAPVPELKPETASALILDEVMAQLQALGEASDAKKTLVKALPESLKAEVMAALKVQKEQASRLDAELDGLL